MKLQDAKLLAAKVCKVLEPLCERVQVAGSIRRGRAEVNDIDVVALPRSLDLPGALSGIAHFNESQVWKDRVPLALKKCGLIVEASGQELLRAHFSLAGDFDSEVTGFQVDVYRARPETWGVILLVRTGSREHNVKLCSLAKSKGYKLSASQGVLDCYGEVMASCTEERIFSVLGLAFVEPKDREVRY